MCPLIPSHIMNFISYNKVMIVNECSNGDRGCIIIILYIPTDVNQNALFVLTEHGGHLGYFEGGPLHPNAITWIDRLLLEYINVCVELNFDFDLFHASTTLSCTTYRY